jgi:hypothetical protein
MYFPDYFPSPCGNCKRIMTSTRNIDEFGITCPKQIPNFGFKPRKKRCKYQIVERHPEGQ